VRWEKQMSKDKAAEIQQNYEAFNKMLPSLIAEHRGKHALMRGGEVIAIYSTAQDAVQTGESFYEDKLFSVQKITDSAVDLGYYSHAMHIG